MQKEEFDEKEFINFINEIFPKISLGLQKRKKFYEDGIMNLNLSELNFLISGSDMANKLLIFLTIMIQSYPKNQIEYEGDELFEWVKSFEFFVTTAISQKDGLINCQTKSKSNKLNSKISVKIEMTEKGVEFAERMNSCNSMEEKLNLFAFLDEKEKGDVY
jgi:hypothetical protein